MTQRLSDRLKLCTQRLTVWKVACIALAAAIGLWIPHNITVTLTPSVSHRVFWIGGKPETSPIKAGTYIMFELPPNEYVPPQLTVKRVVCTPGDTLRLIGDEFYCNNTLLGRGKQYTRSGVKVKLFSKTGIIPLDNYFVMGDHRDSFDSRYFGYVEKKYIKSVVYPII